MPSSRHLMRALQNAVSTLARTIAEGRAVGKTHRTTTETVARARLAEVSQSVTANLAEIRHTHDAEAGQRLRELERVRLESGICSAPWDDARWAAWEPVTQPLEAARLGTFEFADAYAMVRTPALLPFGRPLVVKASGPGKAQAVHMVQALALRLLTLTPPGKLRLLLLDPVGLGENVAMFMNLLEYMPELVGGKAWAERGDVEQRLVDLSAHMEMVIQTYLRGHYPTMEAYNLEAGEVAEPYRLVVAVNFPVNFSEEAAQRLVSIATNGPRCGVSAIVVVDTEQRLPERFNLKDLERASQVVTFQDGRWTDQDPDFQGCQLELDAAPDPALFERLVHGLGAAAKSAATVAVPFGRIAPAPEAWWCGDTARGLSVPIGRAGARRLLEFELGQGTTQHALIAGRTGSGKSTLLHALIMSLALRYSPAELELYLIDFKKGVEFKDYALHELPHARVIAIESEREFGLSVLQGLDVELARRGRVFRDAGVSALAEYRERAAARLARALLLVDEFQEFFVDDDAISRQARLLLDRLARQGRAFGIHIVLGSQSLAGAFMLARATMDQMAVRIALQCSDADSRLVLSEDNPAARLLSRPGEAFYNSSSGLKEGNTRFQTAWLREADREAYLVQLRERAAHDVWRGRPIVFEGNAPARIEAGGDHPLNALLGAEVWPERRALVHAWLGEPVAIKAPTAAVLARRPGRNLLVVGREEDLGSGILGLAVLSIAAQQAPDDAEFRVVDLGPSAEGLPPLAALLQSLLPHPIVRLVPRQAETWIDDLTRVIAARVAGNAEPWPSIYLVIPGVQRVRALRRSEDTGWRRREGEPPAATEQFGVILRDGPDVGVHLVAWAEVLTSVSALDRRALADVGLRIALPMNERDSNDFLDTPAASRLDAYRALLSDDEQVGTLEKFRPYHWPGERWLADMRSSLHARGRRGSTP